MNAMRWSLVVLSVCAGPAVCPADDASSDDVSSPAAYTLEIDGQTVTLTPDKPLKVEGDFTNPTLTLRVAQTRALQGDGIAFHYPAYFRFEADTSDPDVKSWTADGNDVTLMLFSFTEEVDPRSLVESTADALQAQDLKVEPARLKLGDSERDGLKATMMVGEQTLIQQVLRLPPTTSGSRLLIVQEVRAGGEGESAELGATLKVVASSLKVAEK